MTLLDVVRKEINEVFELRASHDGVKIATHCIYPSNSFVQVVVRGGQSQFYVTDEGGAIREIENAGGEIRRPDRFMRNIAHSYGLHVENGVIKSDFIEATAIPIVMAVVANASKDCAEFLFEKARIRVQRDLKKLVSRYLENTFEDKLIKDQIIVGKSNKPHIFDNVVRLKNGKRLIIDPVVYQPSAINAHVIANLDVANAQYSDLEQRIIYDDEEQWKIEDLNMLQIGATVVPFSKAPEVIHRIASNQ